MVISNEKIAPLYMDRVTKIFESAGKMVDTVVLPDGEQYKDLPTLNMIFDKALEKVRMGMGAGGGQVEEAVREAVYSILRAAHVLPLPSLPHPLFVSFRAWIASVPLSHSVGGL